MPRFGRPQHLSRLAKISALTFILLASGWIVIPRIAAKFGDRVESFYPSLSDAANKGVITRGWIPDDFLPSRSHSIHELHDLSPSTEWCAFEFTPTDSQRLLANLKHVEVPPSLLERIPRSGVAWWPADLEGDLDVEKIQKAGFLLYVVERPATSVSNAVWLFAINWPGGRGFFYSKLYGKTKSRVLPG